MSAIEELVKPEKSEEAEKVDAEPEDNPVFTVEDVNLEENLPSIDLNESNNLAEDNNNLDQFIISNLGTNGNKQGVEAVDNFVVSNFDQENEEIPAMNIIDNIEDEAAAIEPEDVGLGADDAAIPEDIQEPLTPPDENGMM